MIQGDDARALTVNDLWWMTIDRCSAAATSHLDVRYAATPTEASSNIQVERSTKSVWMFGWYMVVPIYLLVRFTQGMDGNGGCWDYHQ